MIGRLTRFFFVFLGGLLLVWVLGIGPDGRLFGSRSKAQTPAGARATAATSPPVNPGDTSRPPPAAANDGGSGAEYTIRDGHIPVREVSPDNPDQTILKYDIIIGSSVGHISKRMLAQDVRIDIYDKAALATPRVKARVHGSNAELLFASPPDPQAGFRDVMAEAISLSGDVLVEYLGADGSVLTTLTTDHLDLNDTRFHAPGRAHIHQDGLDVEGEELTYDKALGTFALERNVEVRGSRFSLPGSAPAGDERVDSPERVITCKGRFLYTPDSPADGNAPAPEDLPADPVATFAGGLLSFDDGVRAEEGPSFIVCQHLEIVLARPAVQPAAEPIPGESTAAADPAPPAEELSVSRMVALGSPGRRAEMSDPRGRLLADQLRLNRQGDSQVVQLIGHPEILDAHLGQNGSGGVLAASCAHEMRFLPLTRAEVVARLGDDPGLTDLPEDADYQVLELREQSKLAVVDPDPTKSIDLASRDVDLLLTRRPQAAVANEDAGEDASENAEPTPAADPRPMELLLLLATGQASGQFEGGNFSGDRLQARPRAGTFGLEVTPDPRVKLTSVKDGVTTDISIGTPSGRLVYTPSDDPSGAVKVRFEGPTETVILRDGVLATTLHARDSVAFDIVSAAEDPISELEAVGAVTFDSPAQNASGHGERLTLKPGKADAYKVHLEGTLAHAEMREPGKSPRTIDAEVVDFDPATNELWAWRQVTAVLADLVKADRGGEPGTLRCEILHVVTLGADDAVEVTADHDIVFDDPTQNLHAIGDRLVYTSVLGLADLHGSPAIVSQLEDATAATGEPSVTVTGAHLLLYPDSGSLTCPERGSVTVVDAAATGGPTRIQARSEGPLVVRDDRVDLSIGVVITFEEKRRETRALWSDKATVLFTKEDAPKSDRSGSAHGSFDRLIATGRVHVTQLTPRPLVGEGEHLEWWISSAGQTMLLKGLEPRAWMEGLLSDRQMRYEADSFLLYAESDDFEAENGALVLSPGT